MTTLQLTKGHIISLIIQCPDWYTELLYNKSCRFIVKITFPFVFKMLLIIFHVLQVYENFQFVLKLFFKWLFLREVRIWCKCWNHTNPEIYSVTPSLMAGHILSILKTASQLCFELHDSSVKPKLLSRKSSKAGEAVGFTDPVHPRTSLQHLFCCSLQMTF